MALVDPALRALYDLKVSDKWLLRIIDKLIAVVFKIFVQCDSDLMLARRIQRDIVERGRDVKGILDQLGSPPTFNGSTDFIPPRRYLRYVKPSFDNFVYPTASHADIVCTISSLNIFFLKKSKPFIIDCAGFE